MTLPSDLPNPNGNADTARSRRDLLVARHGGRMVTETIGRPLLRAQQTAQTYRAAPITPSSTGTEPPIASGSGISRPCATDAPASRPTRPPWPPCRSSRTRPPHGPPWPTATPQRPATSHAPHRSGTPRSPTSAPPPMHWNP